MRGDESVHALGFHYVLTPVLLNVLVILSVAILFNLGFSWRRYPASWARKQKSTAEHDDIEQADDIFSRAALTTAANAIDPALGISKHNIETLCSFARCHTEAGYVKPDDIRIGSYYCNGAFGPDWQV